VQTFEEGTYTSPWGVDACAARWGLPAGFTEKDKNLKDKNINVYLIVSFVVFYKQ